MSAWIAIPDVSAGVAKLHLLNSDTWPPTPVIGDFVYNLKNSTMHLFKKDGNGSIMGFTHWGLLFWTCPNHNKDDEPCKFSSVERLVQEFIQHVDPAKTRISVNERLKRRREKAEADTQEDDDMPVQLERNDGPRENSKDPVAGWFRDIHAIRWHDPEMIHVEELMSHQSLKASESRMESCSSGSDPFRVNKLIMEIELDQILRPPDGEDNKALESAWESLIHRIQTYVSKFMSIVIQGRTPQLRLQFSKASMLLQFGDLGMRCQWGSMDVLLPPTETSSQEKKLCTTQASTRNKDLEVEIVEAAPKVIRSRTWSSQGWRLVTHPGYLMLPHHDCCGMGTYVIGNSGTKLWPVMCPKWDVCPSSFKGLLRSLTIASELSLEGKFSDADVTTICLEEGDIIFQPPGVLHSVYTPVPSIFSGGYFYSYNTMHLTQGYLRTLCYMVIGLQYQSEPCEIGKQSLISLLLIIIQCKNPEKTTSKLKNTLADEEQGEVAFAAKITQSILQWMDLTQEMAIKFVGSQEAYYLPGDEIVPYTIFHHVQHFPKVRKAKVELIQKTTLFEQLI
ncbi:hypothetical protein L210DRAFT_3507605 [Boletus edulis BED1]|uniref:JmjC domain-containing protein n=1 Tax=Boletus edulis BED1 TaxID=1328754 RepID=A0AAD4BJV2_BOLED|nr:hypothetical protein L210DRAFT_3507605 [Boletus edulis BED1]